MTLLKGLTVRRASPAPKGKRSRLLMDLSIFHVHTKPLSTPSDTPMPKEDHMDVKNELDLQLKQVESKNRAVRWAIVANVLIKMGFAGAATWLICNGHPLAGAWMIVAAFIEGIDVN